MISKLRQIEFILLSFLLHMGLFFCLFISPAKKEIIEQPLEVVLQPPPPAVQIQPKIPPPPPPPVAEMRPTDKLIEITKKLDSDVVPTTNLVSDQNTKTEKQTQKKNKIKNDQASLDLKNEPEEAKDESPTVAQSSGGLDKIKDVEEGIEDLLNTREFKFFSYFKKLKAYMNKSWEQELIHDRNVASEQLSGMQAGTEFVTKLFVIIGANGELENVSILKSCGIDSLDEAVVEAFKKASPFEKPPQGILESDGSIKITWDFVLD